MDQKAPDPQQRAVIEADPAARILVHAGPGTGKTQVSALRLAHLISAGLKPGEILTLSFSRSAVRTLMRRLERSAGASAAVTEDLRHLSVRTFDSWTFRILRQLGETPTDLLATSYEKNIRTLTERIEGEDASAVRTLLGGVRHVIIDEFQDLPGVRGRLVLALLRLLAPQTGGGAGFTVLGDPAQAIYGFAAGAEDSGESEKEDYWAMLWACYGDTLREIELTRNYRAVTSLSEVTLQLRNILRRKTAGEKKLEMVDRFIDQLPTSTTRLSAEWLICLPEGSVAILTRTNGEALRVAQQLLGKDVEGPGVPFILQLAGYRHPVPAWIAALLSQLRAGNLVKSRFDQIYAHITGKYSAAQIEALRLPPADAAWSRLLHASGAAETETSLDMTELRKRMDWPDAFPDDQAVPDAGLYITTIHQAKGMEFDSVALLRHERGEQESSNMDRAEEACVNFVAITRAGKQLGAIGADCIFKAPVQREFAKGARSRLCHWWSGWVNLEIGIAGDINAAGFVDTRIHEGTEKIAVVQQLLLTGAASLRGYKVLLCKRASPENPAHVLYGIHLQNPDGGPGALIGITAPQLTYDLLSLLSNGFSLPQRIMNLRIGEVVTVRGSDELPEYVPEPYHLSRLWLGVTLIGTGDFKPFKKGGKG
ncbi:MAG TPA: UvrD-helicase domain-containing protein [Burkholderiaceae bacterium]|nr:UvrD-helicase domain-containing protein [Burkholderiaceae bacterium]